MYTPSPRPKRKTERTCLGCGKAFRSTGPGNRLCSACRNRNTSASKYEGRTIDTSPGWKRKEKHG